VIFGFGVVEVVVVVAVVGRGPWSSPLARTITDTVLAGRHR